MSRSSSIAKKVLLTGASGGLGQEIAALLSERGYSLILAGRDARKLTDLESSLEKDGKPAAEVFVCDLSQESEIERLIASFPEVEVLINNAGFAWYGAYHQSTWEQIKAMLMVNSFAPVRLCRHYLPGMLARNEGRILNVASTAGLGPIPYMALYAATKALLVQFSKSLSLEVQGTGVRISCLMPGPIATRFWHLSGADAKVQRSFSGFQSPREVAQTAVALLESGEIALIAGWKNKIKQKIRHYLPERIWFYLLKKHMMHPSLFNRSANHRNSP